MKTDKDNESELLARIAALESELRRLLDLVGVEDRESIERLLDDEMAERAETELERVKAELLAVKVTEEHTFAAQRIAEADVEELKKELERVKKVYAEVIPGAWVCDKCGFTLQKNQLHVIDSSLSADQTDHCEGCPNDGEAMRALTWREVNEDLYKRAVAEIERATKAEAACAEMQELIREVYQAYPRTLQEFADRMAYAASDDAGRDYVHRSELERRDAVIKEMREALERVKQIIADDCTTDEACRCFAREVLPEIVVNGDSYGVPGLSDVVRLLVDALKTAKGESERVKKSCFHCGDEKTRLYCLHCARENYIHRSRLEKRDAVIASMKSALLFITNSSDGYESVKAAQEALARAKEAGL